MTSGRATFQRRSRRTCTASTACRRSSCLATCWNWLAQLRMAAPTARICMLEGNHEMRLRKVLNDVACGELRTLRPADKPSGPELLSIPYLLSLDKLDVEYVEPYGKGHWWRGIHFHHGRLVRSRGGKTVSAMLNNSAHSQVVGHIHRREIASKAGRLATRSRDYLRRRRRRIDAAHPNRER